MPRLSWWTRRKAAARITAHRWRIAYRHRARRIHIQLVPLAGCCALLAIGVQLHAGPLLIGLGVLAVVLAAIAVLLVWWPRRGEW